jgi:hypothetical protein
MIKEYLYPPLQDITDMPKSEVIKCCKFKTLDQKLERKEITLEDYTLKVFNVENDIKEVDIKIEETKEEIKEETQEDIKEEVVEEKELINEIIEKDIREEVIFK